MSKPKPKPTPPTPPPSSKAWENVVGEPEPAVVAVDYIKPPCPETHPELGDLTPAYVAWYKAHHTEEEYIRKYAGRMEIAERQRGGIV
jgi:hypothetical protein